jgi:5-methylcytosine-specific restriction endonuclease McrA
VPCYSKFKGIRKASIRDQYYELKKGLKCCRCGNDDFRVLDFDHTDKSKKEFDISFGMAKGYSLAKIKLEMEKCQVLCANCHRIKTWESNDYGK